MKKITLNDFSGGIQELTSPVDFTQRQWSQLTGIVPRNERIFESQWPIQTIGTGFTTAVAVWPLVCEAGVYLIAITTTGTLYWVKAPDHNAAYGTANSLSWTQITTLSNLDWAAGDSTTQPVATLVNNPEYRFLCSVPVQAYKYVRTPNSSYKSTTVLDTDGADQSAQFSGVLISTAEKNSGAKSTQALIVYVDTNANPVTVRAVSFPNQRRIPVHKWDKVDGVRKSDFINGLYLDNSNNPNVDTMPDWPFNMANLNAPNNSMHPFLWYDINGQEQPGTGIIPRANVGCTKGSKLVLGDIEWRKDFSADLPVLDAKSLATVGKTATTLSWPADVEGTARVIYNLGPGRIFLSDLGNNVNAAVGDNRTVVGRQRTGTTVRLYLKSSIAGITVGTTQVVVNKVGNTLYNGTYTVTATGTATVNGKSYTYIEYTHPTSKTVSFRSSSGRALFKNLVTATNFDIEIPVGGTAAVPNDWVEISAVADTDKTVIQALKNRNLAVHYLNDTNTGPMRSGIYYSAGDLDEFDPRAVKQIGRSDIRIAGLHTINDTVIAITTAGSEGDGVFRIRGYFAAEYPYDGSAPNPNAINIELIKGGVGAPNRATLTGGHKSYSCLWQSTSTVVFIDRLGGIYYTDGRVCDRLDRYGPKKPTVATVADHTAAVGDHLFAYRDGRLLCFSLIASNGTAGEGCWTEIVKPAGTILSMIGAREDLFFVCNGRVMRVATAGLDAERGSIDNVAQTLTVSTPTIGSEDEYDRTNWDKFGMTFSTPTSCTVGVVRVQSTGALDAGPLNEDGSTDPVKHTTTLNRVFNNSNVTGEFVVNCGLGPQNKVSATVTFTGYVRLESAAFWVTGREPRRGDK